MAESAKTVFNCFPPCSKVRLLLTEEWDSLGGRGGGEAASLPAMRGGARVRLVAGVARGTGLCSLLPWDSGHLETGAAKTPRRGA